MAEKSDVFCDIPLGPSALVWAASITVDPPRTREQITQPRVRIQARYSGLLSGPRRGLDRFSRTGECRLGGVPRRKETFRRNGTRLVSTLTSVEIEKAPGSGTWRSNQNRALVVCRAQAGRTRPPNSCSHCSQKPQCLWLQRSDCRLGQYIPEPMASCTIGNNTLVARRSASPTV